MRAFIREFRTTNELLFKERNNSLNELRFEVNGLSKVIDNALISNSEDKGVTTKRGKTTTQGIHYNNTNISTKGPSVFHHDKLVAPIEVLVEDGTQKTKEQVIQPSIETHTPSIRLKGHKPTRMSLELLDRSVQYPRGIVENVLIKVDKFVLPIDFVILDMPEDSRTLMILGSPFLATARAMIDVFNKKITLRVGDDEVIFDVDQSIKKLPAKDDECYDIDDTINIETQELLGSDQSDSFLLKGLEKSIYQSDLESYNSIENESDDNSDIGMPILCIDSVNTPYFDAYKTTGTDGVNSEHMY
ncbi:DNA-directed DNA polymerase [Tanacetum coccineum]